MNSINYLHGLGNHFESEARQGALVIGRNSPQKVPYDLYAEQLSGSAFTAPRHLNLHSWLYRIKPSVSHSEFSPVKHLHLAGQLYHQSLTPPTQMRWNAMPYPDSKTDFIQGLFSLAGNSCAAIYLYAFNTSMKNDFFYNADGEFLIVPQEGIIQFNTEFGLLEVKPGEIAVIPRGIKFQVNLQTDNARGYICENFGAPFRLPELGTMGANALANPRDFEIPTARFEEKKGHFNLLVKFQHHLWSAQLDHSPLNVVAWHGNYVPYKYDLSRFNTINTVSFDHPDPSIFTVLTSPSQFPGVANVDFVIFPPRWMVANDTFRPPYYHRNIMNEFMGLIFGTYDAKGTGFAPGGSSLHNCMSAHGPDANAYDKAIHATLKPDYYANILAFMFESREIWQVTNNALTADFRQQDYLNCWQGLKAHYKSV